MKNSMLARDQYGEPWIVFQHADAMWALGLDTNENTPWPMIRYAGLLKDGDWTIHTDLTKPQGIRNLTVVG